MYDAINKILQGNKKEVIFIKYDLGKFQYKAKEKTYDCPKEVVLGSETLTICG